MTQSDSDNSGDSTEPNPLDARQIQMPLGIVVEKRPSKSRWINHSWKAVAVLPGAGPLEDWKLLQEDGGVERYQIATLTLTLYRSDAEAYMVNLANAVPSVYVVLREAEPDDDPDDQEIRAVTVTASPYEAQDFLDSGDDNVEAVPITEGLAAWIRDYAERHHVEVAFKKRKRKAHAVQEVGFGKQLHPTEQRHYDKQKLN